MSKNLKSLTLTALLLFVTGAFPSAVAEAQDVPVGAADNPAVDKKYLPVAGSVNSTKILKSGSPAEKRALIEQAINDGNKAREASDYEKAFANYSRVADELNPKDARAVYGLGNVYSDLACHDQAVQAYANALRLDKNFHDARIALGFSYATSERYEEADAEFQAVLKTPVDSQARIGLAFIAAKKKHYDEAIDQLNLIITTGTTKAKDRATAYLYLGNIYAEQNKWEDAATNYTKSIHDNPELSVAYIKLGQAKLFPQRSKFSLLAVQEMTVEDRERIVKAATEAAQYIRIAIYGHNYKHPFGDLLLATALMDQFSFQEAFASVDEYLQKVNKLKTHSSALAVTCDLGFKQLYAFADLYHALIYNQQAIYEQDPQKKQEYYSHVREAAQKYIDAKATDPIGYELLGQVNLQKEDFSEAIRVLEKALVYETTDVSKGATMDLLGLCYEGLRHYKEAIHAYNGALKWRPNSTVARYGLARISELDGNFDEAIRLNKEVLELSSEPTASALWHLADCYYLRGRSRNSDADYEEAIRLLKKALALKQSFWAAHLTLGKVYRFYKDDAYADEALAQYQEAEKYEPNNSEIKVLIGDVFYRTKKNYSAAIQYLTEAIKLKPDYAEAYWLLGLVHRERGDDLEAIKQFQTVLKFDDKFLYGYSELAEIYDRQKEYDEAIKILVRAIDKLPMEALPYKELGRVYSHQGKTKQAIENYEQAISLMKGDEAWFGDVLRCRILRLQEKYEESITCAQRLKIPNSADPGQIVYEIGLTYVAKKDKKAALAQYEQLKRMNSNLAEDLRRKIVEIQ